MGLWRVPRGMTPGALSGAGVRRRAGCSILDTHAAFEDLEEFVLVVVFVPDEFALELGDFDVLVVDLADDFGGPEVGEAGAGLEEIDGGDHWVLRSCADGED